MILDEATSNVGTRTKVLIREAMARLRQGRAPSDLMLAVAAEDARGGPYRTCPCGSGEKFRFCHGDRTPRRTFSGVDSAPVSP